MAIVPAGKLIGKGSFGKIYEDQKGNFWIKEKTIQEIIEANVTKGRGYVNLDNPFKIPYAENPLKDKINPKIFCFVNLQKDKFPGFMQNMKEGHPTYSKLYHNTIFLK